MDSDEEDIPHKIKSTFPEEVRHHCPPKPPEETYTLQQAIDRIGFGKFQMKLSVLTGFAWMSDAMEMMILSILSPALHCAWGLTGIKQALLTTIVFCGMMTSSSLWGSFCDKYGRKLALIASSLFTCYFGILSAFSPTFIWMLVLRGLVGFGIGGAPQAITLYAEFLPSSTRATCVLFIEVFWAIGACFEVMLALFIMPVLGWRWLLVLSAVPLLVFSAFCLWLPESARFEICRGNAEKAEETIQRIAKDNGKPTLLGRLKECETQAEQVNRGSILDTLKPDMRLTTILLWLVWFSNSFCYFGVILMTTELFESGSNCDVGNKTVFRAEPHCPLECKMLSKGDYIDLLWTTIAEFPGLFLTILVIDKIGRKLTIGGEFIIFSVFMFFVNICTTREVLIFFLFVARAFISSAFMGAYVYTPEIYPTSMRAIGLGACSTMARIGAIITPFIAQVSSLFHSGNTSADSLFTV
ncbi:synaptic vesicle 2-related protein [Octopus bimaculoides]|uniref:synaptic vesicle 2-related protein n=1 Tax=Octopus bimaculoides TaxID=37653 RepID=UPI0022E01B22|nr:synaptic vesicle 2-related protein [Octopus bimaculoides]